MQTDKWLSVCNEDPQIQGSEARLNAIMKRVSAVIPKQLADGLGNAIPNVAATYADTATLYGIRVADAIHDVVDRPPDLSRHIFDRMQATA